MSAQSGVGLPEALERAASALPAEADAIRPANGDPIQLIEQLETSSASAVLRWLLTEEPADGAELIEAWIDVPERGPAAILGVDDAGLPKPARKALRRAHHQLRSRGVAVPDAAPAPTVAKLPSIDESLDEAILSPLDPRGSRAAYLVASHPQGGVRLFELMFDDARGILECRVYNTGRSKTRQFLKEFERKGALAALSVPPDAVRALVARAAAAHPATRSMPRGYREWSAQIGTSQVEAPTPGKLVREALEPGDGLPALRQVVGLVERGEIGPWPPEPPHLTALAEKLESIAKSTVIVDEEQRRSQASEAMSDALGDVFDAGYAGVTALRFEETAYVFWRRGREEDARACLAAADAFAAGKSGDDNPVALALLEAIFGPALARAAEQAAENADEGAA